MASILTPPSILIFRSRLKILHNALWESVFPKRKQLGCECATGVNGRVFGKTQWAIA